MNFKDAKGLFFKLRAANRIEICENHIIEEHSERMYSADEVISLIRSPGTFHNTTDKNYFGKRFY